MVFHAALVFSRFFLVFHGCMSSLSDFFMDFHGFSRCSRSELICFEYIVILISTGISDSEVASRCCVALADHG